MGMSKYCYVIAGYDLTGRTTDKFEDWKYEEGEKYFCYPRKNNIQLFKDLSGGEDVYLGYIFAAYDEDEYNDTVYVDLDDLAQVKGYVTRELLKLATEDVINIDVNVLPKYRLIVFEESY